MGASGRLGAMLRAHWPADAPALRLQSRRGGAGVVACDPLADPDGLARLAQGCAAVVCLPGVTPARAAATGDAMTLNAALPRAALAAAAPGARVFAISSAAIYGAQPGPLSEEAPGAPLSAYGESKIEMEKMIAREGGARAHVLRIGNVTGADAILGGWTPGMTLDQFADGRTPRRSYIGPVSLARVIARLCTAPQLPQTLNIAAPGTVEMGALLDAAGLAWSPRPAPAAAIAEVALQTTRLETLYAFAAEECTARGMVAQLGLA